jgi:hypothetical protein
MRKLLITTALTVFATTAAHAQSSCTIRAGQSPQPCYQALQQQQQINRLQSQQGYDRVQQQVYQLSGRRR